MGARIWNKLVQIIEFYLLKSGIFCTAQDMLIY